MRHRKAVTITRVVHVTIEAETDKEADDKLKELLGEIDVEALEKDPQYEANQDWFSWEIGDVYTVDD